MSETYDYDPSTKKLKKKGSNKPASDAMLKAVYGVMPGFKGKID